MMLTDQTKFSYLESVRSTDCKVISWSEVKQRIINGEFAEPINRIRATESSNDRRKMKADTLPCVLFGGVFADRNDSGLRLPSGEVIIDIDHVENVQALKAKIIKDPCVSACFFSPSGDGLKILMPIGNRDYREGWDDCKAYLSKHYKIEIDKSGCNESRLCFYSYDPELYENQDAFEVPKVERVIEQEKPIERKKPEYKQAVSEILTSEDVAYILSFIPPRPDYDSWIKICSGVWNEIGEAAGTSVLNYWSPEENQGEYDLKYRHRLKDIGIATVIFTAKQYGYEPRRKELNKAAKEQPIKAFVASEEVEQMPKVYYDGSRYYYPRVNARGWAKLDISSVRRQLKKYFYYDGKPDKEALDEHLNNLQLANYVDYAGALAGYRIGETRDASKLWLVTSECDLLEPEEGSCGEIIQFIDTLLGDEQSKIFYQWLKVSWVNFIEFRNGSTYRPAPAIAFCGKRGCGKTLVIEIIKMIFNRYTSGYLWLCGKSEFNGELAGSELIVIDDEAGVTDSRLRRQAASKIKASMFSGGASIHAKGKDAITARPWWRMVFAVNDEPESLQVLPLLDPTMDDKIILFECDTAKIPFLNDGLEARERKIREMVPAFVRWIEMLPSMPEQENTRTGVPIYWNNSILQKLGDLSPEKRLLDLIDEELGEKLPNYYFVGEIERTLKNADGFVGNEARTLLKHGNSCGTFMARLAITNPERVTLHSSIGHKKRYFINSTTGNTG
jgi:hypothetical protein